MEFNQNRLSRFSFETDICTHTYIIYIYVYRERQQSGYKCYSWRRITRKGQNFELSPTRMNINFQKRFFSLFFSSPREEEEGEPLKSVAFLSNPIADVSPPSPLSPILVFFPGHVSTIKKTLSVGKWDARETASCNNFLREWPATALHEERRKRRQPRK